MEHGRQVKTGKPDGHHFCSKFVSDWTFVSVRTVALEKQFSLSPVLQSSVPHTGRCSSIVRTDRRLMGSISHAIGPKLGFHHQVSHCSNGLFGFNGDKFLSLSSRKLFGRICASVDVKDERKNTAIDFSDPDWKMKYQADFEKRFSLPHITDVFGDAVPIPSTFCLKMRCCSLFSFSFWLHDSFCLFVWYECRYLLCVFVWIGIAGHHRFRMPLLEVIRQMKSGMDT